MESGVSIIIPAYNEAEAISGVLKTIKDVMTSSNWKYEIIVIDDGSTDNTAEIVRKIPRIKFLRNESNKGYGAALKEGIKRSTTGTIVMMDADGTYPAQEIPNLIRHMEKYDMAVGARTGGKVEIPILRRPAKFFLSLLANYLSGIKIPDLNSGMRVFKKDVVMRFLNILPSGFSFTTTLTLACLSKDYSVKYVPINYYKRKGQSTIHPIKDFMNFTLLIFRTIMYFKPLKVFLPVGFLILFLGLGKLFLIDILINRNIADLSVMLTLSGIQICFFGFLADLIVKRL